MKREWKLAQTTRSANQPALQTFQMMVVKGKQTDENIIWFY